MKKVDSLEGWFQNGGIIMFTGAFVGFWVLYYDLATFTLSEIMLFSWNEMLLITFPVLFILVGGLIMIFSPNDDLPAKESKQDACLNSIT